MINLYNCFLRLKFCLIIVAQKKKACFLYETEQNNSSFLSSLPAFLPSFPFSFSLLIPSFWTYYLIHWGLLVIQPFCSYRAWLGTLWETIVRRHKRGCPWIPCLCRFSRFTLCFFFQRLSLLELLYVSGINIWLKYFENFYLHFDIFPVFYFLSFFFYWTKERRNSETVMQFIILPWKSRRHWEPWLTGAVSEGHTGQLEGFPIHLVPHHCHQGPRCFRLLSALPKCCDKNPRDANYWKLDLKEKRRDWVDKSQGWFCFFCCLFWLWDKILH